jgi:hypothetical protein
VGKPVNIMPLMSEREKEKPEMRLSFLFFFTFLHAVVEFLYKITF